MGREDTPQDAPSLLLALCSRIILSSALRSGMLRLEWGQQSKHPSYFTICLTPTLVFFFHIRCFYSLMFSCKSSPILHLSLTGRSLDTDSWVSIGGKGFNFNFYFSSFFFLFCFFGHTWRCTEVIPGFYLRDYSWQCSRDHMGCWELNPGRLRARQMLYQLYCLSRTFFSFLKGDVFIVGRGILSQGLLLVCLEETYFERARAIVQ